MNITEFCDRFDGRPQTIEEVVRSWRVEELDSLLKVLCADFDQLIGCGVIAGDALHGDGLLDQIPRELHDAFHELMHKSARSYAEMRQILLDHIRDGHGGFLSFDDHHVVGFISKLKGQIGENMFAHNVGAAAELAPSGSQEAWDIAVKHGSGAHEYVQVKLHASPSSIVRHMQIVHDKVANGEVPGLHGEIVDLDHIRFAVPDDVAAEVRDRLAEHHPELLSMLHEQTIPISPAAAAGIVEEGLNNVGPHQLSHFFHEVLGGAVAAGSLHALVNGFLWYKGAKQFSEAFASATASTAISTTGLGLGLATETFYHAVALSSAVGIGSRILLGRMARSRWNFADFLENSIAVAESQIAALQRLHGPEPAVTRMAPAGA